MDIPNKKRNTTMATIVTYPNDPETIYVYLDEMRHPTAYNAMKKNLVDNGLSELDAEKIIREGIELEVIYEQGQGLFAVESEAIDTIVSPYTSTPLKPEDLYEEVRCDYHDDENHYTTIDAREPNCDEGNVVAVVHDSGDVWFIDNTARASRKVLEAIDHVKETLKSDK